MTQPESIRIDDVEYVRADQAPVAPWANSPVRIVILQRGNVMVGRWSRDGEMCFLDDAKVIRRWGTTKGLGQIASGPLADTVLDPTNGRVEFHVLAMVASIEASESGWS